MCGRLTTTISSRAFEAHFGVQAPLDFRASANVSPRKPLPVLHGETPSSAMLPWGFKPEWSADDLINARAETVRTVRTFREDILERRVVVACSGWLEWLGRQPYYLTVDGAPIMTVAGIVHPTPQGERVLVLTTRPQAEIVHLHRRQPLILPGDAWQRWLEPLSPRALEAMLEPVEHDLAWWAVDRRVGNASNDDPALLRPLELVDA